MRKKISFCWARWEVIKVQGNLCEIQVKTHGGGDKAGGGEGESVAIQRPREEFLKEGMPIISDDGEKQGRDRWQVCQQIPVPGWNQLLATKSFRLTPQWELPSTKENHFAKAVPSFQGVQDLMPGEQGERKALLTPIEDHSE